MSLASEFKEFAMKGSVIDLAVGVVIGGAFGKIIASLVGDVIMPALSPMLGSVNFGPRGADCDQCRGKARDAPLRRVSSDDLRVPGDRAVTLHRHQGHQQVEAPCPQRTASRALQD